MPSPRPRRDPARILFWVTHAVYLPLGYFVYLVWSLSGGFVVWDLQVLGYSAEWVQRFLAALPPEGAEIYIHRVRPLDTVIPVLLAVTISAFALKTRVWWRWVCVAIAANTALLDLLENVRLVALVSGVVAPSPEAVAAVSWVTQAKFASLATSLAVLVLAQWRTRHA
ncbi:hypothetical protein [Actibacterium sp. 188UL27-1]|uniref:hypothetical protein n=1 Tax=Actibacterium sp. 188UL27-1 TaxID=2786961 RepID=UPI0019579D1F|nr:hypothetical protein [Actibacterium sp. 188UL27-1]MBM7066103.1 hypothetical protein [Actibacterium sp. 188UL27-1]